MSPFDHKQDEVRSVRPKLLPLTLGVALLVLSWFLWPANIGPLVELFGAEDAWESFGTWDLTRSAGVSALVAWMGWWALVEGLRGRVVRVGMLPVRSDTTGIGGLAWSRIVQVAPEAVLGLRPAHADEFETRWRWPYFRDGHHDHLLRYAMPFLAGRSGMSTDGFHPETGTVDVPRSWGKLMTQKPMQVGFLGLLVPLSLMRVAAVGGFGDWAVFALFAAVYWVVLTFEWTKGSAAVVRPGIVVESKGKAVAFATEESAVEGADGQLEYEVHATSEYRWRGARRLQPGDRVVLLSSSDEEDDPHDVTAVADLASHDLIPRLLERRIPAARWRALERSLPGTRDEPGSRT
jgi:hypothetical protein